MTAGGEALRAGDLVPHFTVTAIDGTRVAYSAVWQRRNLLMVSLGSGEGFDAYARALTAMSGDWHEQETACVITRERIPGLPSPGVTIADRWGEIHVVAGFDSADVAPAPADLLDWVAHVRMKCPECEGEAR